MESHQMMEKRSKVTHTLLQTTVVAGTPGGRSRRTRFEAPLSLERVRASLGYMTRAASHRLTPRQDWRWVAAALPPQPRLCYLLK